MGMILFRPPISTMPKYEYKNEFEISGGPRNPDLPILETASLQEALDYLEDAKDGSLMTRVEAEIEPGEPVILMPMIEYSDLKNKSESEAYALLDIEIDSRLQLFEKALHESAGG